MNFRDAQPLQALSPNLNRRSIIKNDTRQLKAPTAKRRFRDKNYNSNIFPHILSMYKKAPTNSVDLYKFEKLAMCRYKILLELDSLAAVSAKHSEDWRRRLEERLATIKVEGVELGKWFTEDVKVEKLNSSEYQTNILYDQWSHFILKLAYSRNEELKNWFLQHETDLFQYRLDKQTTHKYDLSIDKFMELENVELRKTDESIKRNPYINAQILEDHKRSKYNDPNTQKPKVPQNPKNEYYECSWMDVLHLVKTRQVHIENGKAYVPKNLIKHILVERFREEMKMKLAQGRKHWASGGLQSEEKRLLPILNYFSKQNIQDYSSKNIDENTLTSKNIDDRAVTSYPLCMSNIHNHWRKTHHLKHFARLSYWRFLKSAGLSMEDCLKLFRDEGSKYPNGAKQFEKEFAYNIKHAYGKVGARAEYTGFSCAKILSEHVSQGDCHGCPYKNDSEEELVAKLKASGISEVEQLKEVLKLKSSGHFQLACAKQFQHGFGWFSDISFNLFIMIFEKKKIEKLPLS